MAIVYGSGVFIAGNESVIASNESLIAGNESVIASNEGLIASNESLIASNESVIASNESVIASNESVIAGNESVIAGNEGLIASNESVITGNEGFIAARRLPLVRLIGCFKGVKHIFAQLFFQTLKQAPLLYGRIVVPEQLVHLHAQTVGKAGQRVGSGVFQPPFYVAKKCY
jgi:hypothetical protein